MSALDLSVTVVTQKSPEEQAAWRREWTIAFLRGERGRFDCPEDGAWTMSREDIVRVLECFESSGASPEEAENMTWFLPEQFCVECLRLGGVHVAAETDDDVAVGRRFWVAGPAPSAAVPSPHPADDADRT